MDILVTGGAGFIGSHLVDALAARGDRVRVVDNLESQVHRGKKPAYLHPKAEYLFCDFLDPAVAPRLYQEVEAVIHLAALVGVGQSMYQVARYVEGNTFKTAKLLEILLSRRTPLKKLVVASSMSLYGEGLYRCPTHGELSPEPRSAEQLDRHDWELRCPTCGQTLSPVATPEEKPLRPTSVYAISKRDQEELALSVAQAYGIPAVALRFFNVYGPRQSLSNPYTGACAIFSSRLRNQKPPIIYEDGKQTRDFIHVSDISRAIQIALDHPKADGQALNIGTGRAVSILEVAQTLGKVHGVQIAPTIAGRFRAGDIRHCFADIRRLTTLGFKPRVPLQEGLKELAQWSATAQAEDLFDQAEQELVQRRLLGT